MDRHDDDDDSLRSTKSKVMTGSLTCFHDNEAPPSSSHISNSIILLINRPIAARFQHSMNNNIEKSCLVLDNNHANNDNNNNNNHKHNNNNNNNSNNNRTLGDFTAISPCSKIVTVPARPMTLGSDFRKMTPDIEDPYFYHHQLRNDIWRLCCISIDFFELNPGTRSIFLSNEMSIYYNNNDLSIINHILGFPKIWTPLEKLEIFERSRYIPVLDEHNLDRQQLVMRPSILHELLFALLITLTCTVTPSGLQRHDHSLGGFSIFSSSYVNKVHFFSKASTESAVAGGDDCDSADGNDGNGKNNKRQETLFSSYCSKLLEALVIFYSASPWTWEGFGGNGGNRKYLVERWSLRSLPQLVLVTVDPWLLECKRRTLSFFTVTGESSDCMYVVKNKLIDGGSDRTDLFKILLSSTSLPRCLDHQAQSYMLKNIGSTEYYWRQLHDDIIIKAPRSFDGDSDIGDVTVNTLSELLKFGQGKWKHNKSLAKNVLRIVKMFAHTMVSVQSNSDLQPHILQFMHSIQQIGGIWSTDRLMDDGHMDKATQTTTTFLDENHSIQKTVDQLRDALRIREETIIKMQQEKHDLEMKIMDQGNTLSTTQQQLEQQKGLSMLHQRPTEVTVDSQMVHQESTIPTPPPPPPPPPPLPTFDNFSNGRKIRSRSSSKSSTYLHPLDLNLNFASLKSLHENNPSSPTSPNAFDSIINDSSISEDVPHQQTIMDQSRLQQAPKITMKQFFWSKLPRGRIQNTVWKEISSDESTMAGNSSTDRRGLTRQRSKRQQYQHHVNKRVELDFVELEKLFKKSQNGKKHSVGHHQGLHATTRLRKQPLVTLLEFNRANNIAIMLARIKLTYSQICDSIWTIDDHRLNVDNLMAIRQYIPTKEEIEVIQDYTGDGDTLGNAEKYFRTIMDIPRLTDRIDCIIFRRKFHHEIQELLPELNILQLAIKELRYSHQFKFILKTILAIGNHLNDHTIRGDAYGFHLDALLKMGDTKTEDKGDIDLPTLLHYLVFFLSKTGQQVVDTFKGDVPHLESAAQISPPSLFASVKILDGNLGHIRNELAIHQQKPIRQKMDRFTELMKAFLEEAEPIAENVKNLARDIQEQLKDLIMYYGEDPTLVKPQDFFSIICTFSSSFEKAKVEVEQARQKALRRRQQQQHQQQQRLDSNKKISIVSLAPSSLSSTVTSMDPIISRNLTRTSLRTVSTTSTRDSRPNNEGFGQVLQELRAGLKRVEKKCWSM